MKRVQFSLVVAASIATVIAAVIGFVPARSGACFGSYFIPWEMNGIKAPDGSVALSTLCRANGYPAVFWVVALIALALWIAVTAVLQVRNHRREQGAQSSVVVAPPALSAAPPRYSPNRSDMVAQLERLDELHKTGALTADEFAAAKARLLQGRSR